MATASATAGSIVSTPVCSGSIAPARASPASAVSANSADKRQTIRARGLGTKLGRLIARRFYRREGAAVGPSTGNPGLLHSGCHGWHEDEHEPRRESFDVSRGNVDERRT